MSPPPKKSVDWVDLKWAGLQEAMGGSKPVQTPPPNTEGGGAPPLALRNGQGPGKIMAFGLAGYQAKAFKKNTSFFSKIIIIQYNTVLITV